MSFVQNSSLLNSFRKTTQVICARVASAALIVVPFIASVETAIMTGSVLFCGAAYNGYRHRKPFEAIRIQRAKEAVFLGSVLFVAASVLAVPALSSFWKEHKEKTAQKYVKQQVLDDLKDGRSTAHAETVYQYKGLFWQTRSQKVSFSGNPIRDKQGQIIPGRYHIYNDLKQGS